MAGGKRGEPKATGAPPSRGGAPHHAPHGVSAPHPLPGRGIRILAHVVGGVWGLPQNLVGAVMALCLYLRGARSRRYRLARVSEWGMSTGLSLGFFVFVPKDASPSLVVHEYGHTMQSLICGPVYPVVVVVPSLLWAGIPAFGRMRKRRGISYYDHPVERWANVLGERVTGERAPR